MLRQNRDLAKSNNIRALRIRELENDCACMLSENLELRGRILELEKEAEDNDARRIADHALAIKAKLESQLTEWGTMLAGLGLEPPMKRHSPHIRRRISKQRMSFSSNRPSPSQRRLRDVASQIEGLGQISEHKSTSRKSMKYVPSRRLELPHHTDSYESPEQILALKSEAEMAESPELGPPPVSHFIDDEPVKVDSPSRAPPTQTPEPSPKRAMAPPVAFPSPQPEKRSEKPASPEKKSVPLSNKQDKTPEVVGIANVDASNVDAVQPIKIGAKRKLAVRDEVDSARVHRITDENKPPRVMAEKGSIREKAGGKTLKELANMRKEGRDKPAAPPQPRKALSAKSTNNDVSSPKKISRPAIMDEVAAAKADFIKSKAAVSKLQQDRPKPKSKNPPPVKIEAAPSPAKAPPVTELGVPLTETALLSPHSPEPVSSSDGPRGDTPPPADITSNGETTRPSRRSKAAVSYAEPNLRDKMRRPSKALFDAVAGEGKNARRLSQCEPMALEPGMVKRESDVDNSWRHMPASETSAENQRDTAPASPLAGKGAKELPSTVAAERRRRPSAAKFAEALEDTDRDTDASNGKDGNEEANDGGDVDVYDFTPSSPHTETQDRGGKRTINRRQSKSSRRYSAAVKTDDAIDAKDRGSSRRRSMML